jgi:predicted nucleic acid-binding protein
MGFYMTRVYVDTSVFGGVFDEEFKTHSIKFFNDIKNGFLELVTSEVVLEET